MAKKTIKDYQKDIKDLRKQVKVAQEWRENE